ncbi:unnamed protein product [Cladocopium goreaui]|uniref:PPM-type phosphatase domain-containing protein n=1 Tax=Cladocopium goreaui TaxID=2562237 RepID=A0A9P1FTT7_9DINO|nr:unnamed protein product [Cladocopium goreaui]
MERWRPRAYYLVVLLFRGVFQDQRLGNILQCAFDPDIERSLEVVTVVADTHFDFLGLSRSRSGDSVDQLDDNQQMTQTVYRRLLNVVALPFSPLASDSLQKKQVAEISLRFHRYKDLAAATVRDAADDQLATVTAAWSDGTGQTGHSDAAGDVSGLATPECPYQLTTGSFGSDRSDVSDAFSM